MPLGLAHSPVGGSRVWNPGCGSYTPPLATMRHTARPARPHRTPARVPTFRRAPPASPTSSRTREPRSPPSTPARVSAFRVSAIVIGCRYLRRLAGAAGATASSPIRRVDPAARADGRRRRRARRRLRASRRRSRGRRRSPRRGARRSSRASSLAAVRGDDEDARPGRRRAVLARSARSPRSTRTSRSSSAIGSCRAGRTTSRRPRTPSCCRGPARVTVHRDATGVAHELSAVCPHFGCIARPRRERPGAS